MPIDFYIGAPGMGKTTLAQKHAVEKSAARGVPVVVMDPEGVLMYEDALKFPHVDKPLRSSEEAEAEAMENRIFGTMADAVWKEGRHVLYHVRDEDDAARFFQMIKKGGNVVLLVDECSYWARGNSALPSLLSLCRSHRLYGVDLLFTTQYPADLNPLVWNVKAKVYIFRCQGAGALDRMEDELGLSEETLDRVKKLPPMEFLEWPAETPTLPTPPAPSK